MWFQFKVDRTPRVHITITRSQAFRNKTNKNLTRVKFNIEIILSNYGCRKGVKHGAVSVWLK